MCLEINIRRILQRIMDRWGTKICGVDVKEPLAILDVPEEERNVVICCMYYDSISAQLKSMGVEHSEFQDRYYV